MTEQTTHTLELVKTAETVATYKRKPVKLPTYEVRLDGEAIGYVERQMLTRERRTPGRRYVDARWSSPGWTYRTTDQRFGRSLEALSRRDGVERLVHGRDGMSWSEAEALVAGMKVTR